MAPDQLASIYVADLTEEHVGRWAERLAAGGRSGPTINRFLSLASGAWKYARKFRHTRPDAVNPFKGEREPEPAGEPPSPMSAEQATLLVEQADADFQSLLLTALATGMRRRELLALSWERVDFRRNVLVIPPPDEKARRGREVPMTAELRDVLTSVRSTSGPVFRTAEGKPHTVYTVRSRLARLREAVREADILEPRQMAQFRGLHYFRRTALSLMADQGTPLEWIRAVSGHSTEKALRHYLGNPSEGKRRAIEKYAQIRFTRAAGE